MALSQRPLRWSSLKVVLGRECFGAVARWRRDKASNSDPNCAAVDWLGEFPPRSPGNEGQAFSVARAGGGMPVETKKARSVVALSRVPRGERGAPVRLRLPVTVARSEATFNGIPGERCWPFGKTIQPDQLTKRPSVSSSLGGCPASCPDTYRLTHDHRHVRNWARTQIRFLNRLRKNFFGTRTNFLRASAKRGAEPERMLSFFNGT